MLLNIIYSAITIEKLTKKINVEKGNKNAMNTLGRQYLMGNGFAKDYQKAEMWLKKR